MTGESLENKHTSKQTLYRERLILKFIISPNNAQVLCHKVCFYVDKGEWRLEKEIKLKDGSKSVTYSPLLNCSVSWNSEIIFPTSRTVMSILRSINVTKKEVYIFTFIHYCVNINIFVCTGV